MRFAGLYFVRGVERSLELWAREALGCCKQSLMGRSGRNMGEQNAEKSAQWDPSTESLEGTGYSIGNLAGDCLCHILAKNLTAFCSCPEKQRKADFLKVID